MPPVLGHLEKVDLRYAWEREDSEFTPWLAREENLASLGDVIGLELELEAVEQNVGPFRADILCKDTASNQWVLIENQLEKTDHTHLGQLLTYAAGLEAVTLVWIARQFTEEHRATLDWLNQITDERFSLFGIEIELWRIGDSPIAPKFNVIAKPNEWSRSASQSAKGIENTSLSPVREKQLRFWEVFYNHFSERKTIFKLRTPKARHYMDFSCGRSGFNLGAAFYSRSDSLHVSLWVSHKNAHDYFDQLLEQKDQIETELGQSLTWKAEAELQRRTCVLERNMPSPLDDEALWPEYIAWFEENLTKMYNVFAPRIKQL